MEASEGIPDDVQELHREFHVNCNEIVDSSWDTHVKVGYLVLRVFKTVVNNWGEKLRNIRELK